MNAFIHVGVSGYALIEIGSVVNQNAGNGNCSQVRPLSF